MAAAAVAKIKHPRRHPLVHVGNGEVLERRYIRVYFDDTDSLDTEINGTEEEIRRHYLGQRFEITETEFHTATRVEFLDA